MSSNSPLSHLSRPSTQYPRRFAPEKLNASDWLQLEPLYKELLFRPLENSAAFRRWVEDRSELDSIVKEEESRLYIAMTCDTQNPLHSAAFQHFIEEIEPRLAPLSNQLDQKMVSSNFAEDFEKEHPLWFKSLRTSIELFREENIAVETAIALEIQRYQQLTGSQSAHFRGEQKTLIQLSSLLEENDRTLREEAWRVITMRREEDREALDLHFETLFELRQKVSRQCGYPSFVDYIFEQKNRWDYTAADCQKFHAAVEESVVPLYRKILKRRAAEMKLDRLRPWDLACDSQGREPLKIFDGSHELEEIAENIFSAISPRFKEPFQKMRDLKLLDLDNRPGKAPGGYQSALDELRLPFIFMNSVGTTGDLFTLLHEGGHSFHQFFMAPIDLLAEREPPLEFAEVASMSMELLGLEQLHRFFPSDVVARIRREQLEAIPGLLCWIAQIDAFQIWLYQHPQQSRQERYSCWLDLDRRFGPGEIVDWSDLENFREIAWQKQLHLFEVPFYYIEYGIAQLGALQVWDNFRKHHAEAVDNYAAALSMGGKLSLKELFSKAGIAFGMDSDTFAPLLGSLTKELNLESLNG